MDQRRSCRYVDTLQTPTEETVSVLQEATKIKFIFAVLESTQEPVNGDVILIGSEVVHSQMHSDAEVVESHLGQM